MNITEDSIKKLNELGYNISFYDAYFNECDKMNCHEYIVRENFDGETWPESYSFKPKKSETTPEYILNKIAQKQNYKAVNWNAVFEPLNLNNVGFYTASYGVGVEVIFGQRKETINLIKAYLDEHGIIYTNEYSNACWVYRFKISKALDNITKLQTS